MADKKPPSEKETRQKLLTAARTVGCEEPFLKIMQRYDDLLKGARTAQEKELIQRMGIQEISVLFNNYKNPVFTDQYGRLSVLLVNGKVL